MSLLGFISKRYVLAHLLLEIIVFHIIDKAFVAHDHCELKAAIEIK